MMVVFLLFQFRCMWYQLMAAIESDEAVQRKGFVTVSYNVGCRKMDSSFYENLKRVGLLMEAIPSRNCGLHFCYDNPQLRPLALLIQSTVNRENRLRFRTHYGTLGSMIV